MTDNHPPVPIKYGGPNDRDRWVLLVIGVVVVIGSLTAIGVSCHG